MPMHNFLSFLPCYTLLCLVYVCAMQSPETGPQTFSRRLAHTDWLPPWRLTPDGWRGATPGRCSAGCSHAARAGYPLPGTGWPPLCYCTLVGATQWDIRAQSTAGSAQDKMDDRDHILYITKPCFAKAAMQLNAENEFWLYLHGWEMQDGSEHQNHMRYKMILIKGS